MAKAAMIVWNDFRNDARVRKEAETLQAAGHEVTVFALHTPGKTAKRQTLASGVKVVRVDRSPFWALREQMGLLRQPGAGGADGGPTKAGKGRTALRVATRGLAHGSWLARIVASRPDVIHAHDVNTLPTAWLASLIARAPLVYDAHEISTDREGYGSVRNLVGWVEKKLMPRASATITTTDARAKFFARAYGIPRPLVLQNRPRFEQAPRTDRLREELGLRPDWPIILYQGGIQQGRGLHKLIVAAGDVPQAYLVFIGGGRLEGELQALVASRQLGEKVRFIPTVDLDQLLTYTRSADIGVQPIENTCLNHLTTDSNKLFEYVMAGLPVVTSDLPEIRKIVNAYQFGLLVPPGDVDALTVALRQLAGDPILRARLAANAEHAAASLTWEAQEGSLIDLYGIIGDRLRNS